MVAKKDLQKLSADELDSMLMDLDKEMAKLREDKGRVTEVYDAKRLEEEAKRRVGTMSEPERDALLQMLQTESIESEESVQG